MNTPATAPSEIVAGPQSDDRQQDREAARREVLVENTAQAVHKHLAKLFAEEERFRSRWIWELLQNARDAAPPRGVSVWVIHEPTKLIFRHNGLPFTDKNVVHLIYHGSTKHNLADDGSIGQFGTGFLTTHLLSREVTVKGATEGGRRFCFNLKRHGNTAGELKDAMNQSWDDFLDSQSKEQAALEEGYTTEYIYHLSANLAQVVTTGLDDLTSTVVYLFTFNERLVSVRVTRPGDDVVMSVAKRKMLADTVVRLKVDESRKMKDVTHRHVVVMTEGNGSVSVEVTQLKRRRWKIVPRQNSPCIFVAFPLTATRDFCLPAVVNNEEFQPREDRDTLYLKSGQGVKHPNMPLLEQAVELSSRLAIFAAERTWVGAVYLARLSELRDWDWLDTEWLRMFVVDHLIAKVRNAEIMPTEAGYEERKEERRIAPLKGLIPFSTDEDSRAILWDLTAKRKGATAHLPRRTQSRSWASNLSGWAHFLAIEVEELEEAWTLTKLCKEVEATATVAGWQNKLAKEKDAVVWLNELHTLIIKMNREDLFSQMRLIPNQNGDLRRAKEVKRDIGINDDLKDIAECLGLAVRVDLVHLQIDLQMSETCQLRTQEEVLASTVQRLKEQAKSITLSSIFKDANVKLFVWLVQHGHVDKLDGFPALTRASSDTDPSLITLLRDNSRAEEMPLAPAGCWPKAAQTVADLFPRQHILSDDYFKVLGGEKTWQGIGKAGWIRLDPSYLTKRHVPFIHDEPLPDKQRHRTKEAIDVLSVAFFDKEGAGLDTIRRSKDRAMRFLQFLSEHVLVANPNWLDPMQAKCECGETHYCYRAAWLVPMWENKWVPLGDGKQSLATAETIARLFEGQEGKLRQFITGNGVQVLKALKISLAGLSLYAVAKDDETRVSLMGSLTDLVQAFGNDSAKVQLLAQEMKHSPELLDAIRERRQTREKIRHNQVVGSSVEKLLREALEHLGLSVSRTGVGSDLEVEQDLVEDGRGFLLTVEGAASSILIEVKATFDKSARMTITQAKTASENKERFYLCIVQLSSPAITVEAVRDGCRFIPDIGSRIGPALTKYNEYQTKKIEVCAQFGDVELVMTKAEVRFSVDLALWNSGLQIEQAFAKLIAGVHGSDSTAAANGID